MGELATELDESGRVPVVRDQPRTDGQAEPERHDEHGCGHPLGAGDRPQRREKVARGLQQPSGRDRCPSAAHALTPAARVPITARIWAMAAR